MFWCKKVGETNQISPEKTLKLLHLFSDKPQFLEPKREKKRGNFNWKKWNSKSFLSKKENPFISNLCCLFVFLFWFQFDFDHPGFDYGEEYFGSCIRRSGRDQLWNAGSRGNRRALAGPRKTAQNNNNNQLQTMSWDHGRGKVIGQGY